MYKRTINADRRMIDAALAFPAEHVDNPGDAEILKMRLAIGKHDRQIELPQEVIDAPVEYLAFGPPFSKVRNLIERDLEHRCDER